jgi:hypothetical protein
MRQIFLDDNILYIDDPSFYCEIENNEGEPVTVYLGLVFEAMDLRDIDDTVDEDEPYPVVIESQVIVAPRSLSREYMEENLKSEIDGLSGNDTKYPNKYSDDLLAWASYRYSGGVPVNMETIKGSVSSNIDSEVRTRYHRLHGEIKVRYFRTIEDALDYAKEVYAHNSIALFGLIGFYLDKPLNLAGTTGWDIIQLQALNKDYKIW